MKKYKYIDKEGKIYAFTKEEAITIRKSEGVDTTEGWKFNLWVKGDGFTNYLVRKLPRKKEELYFEKLKEWNNFNQKIWS